jgi:alpha-tubulin suppressor-like RCC1 family protein
VLFPTYVSGLSDATRITTGLSHTCALRATGAIVCWGSNTSGQLGDGTTTRANAPVAVAGLT